MSNVKIGDLAVVVGALSTPEAIVRIVVVVRKHKKGDLYEDGFASNITPTYNLHWWVRSVGGHKIPRRSIKGIMRYYYEVHCADAHLRPIRDQEGEDEMLRIAGKPKSKEKTK